jgi:hypothetical protein
MPTIQTLGLPSKRTEFTYSGSVNDGVMLHYDIGRVGISSEFFEAILNCFRGTSILGGFSMTNPTPGGFGVWVEYHSQQLNQVKLTPRHASFIAAILKHEGYITSSLKENAVMLHFPFE